MSEEKNNVRENKTQVENKTPKLDLYWKARDSKPAQKTVDHYWIFWIIIILLILWNVFFEDNKIIAILIFLIGAISTYIWNRDPVVVQYRIVDDGILVDNESKTILFDDIESYNLNKEEGWVYINTKKKYETLIHIPFENNHDIDVIDNALKSKIKKDPKLQMPLFEEWLRKILGW